MLFMLLIYSTITICSSIRNNNDHSISSVDSFPHNIDKDFTLKIHHPELEYHHLYAVYILHVKCPNVSESQKLFIYPGFTKELDHRLKETLFHIRHFETSRFNTKIVLRFYRESRDCNFAVEYSAVEAEHIYLRMPTDIVHIYDAKIILFRPASLKLLIKAEDGHEGGLSIGMNGIISCVAMDGFPFKMPVLTFNREIQKMQGLVNVENSVSTRIVGAVADHGCVVKCTCGSVSVTKTLRVFHHAKSVEITPASQQWFRQGSKLTCTSHGGGYPMPVVTWTVAGLNDTTKRFFVLSKLSHTVSVLTIGASTPNNTKWQLECSSINIIPPMDHGGPSKMLNITIGDNIAGSIMLANYLWIIVVLVVIVIIFIVVAIVCLWSRTRSSHRRRSAEKAVPLAPSQPYDPVTQSDSFDNPAQSSSKLVHECVV